MNRQEAVEILMEQADYWRSLIKRNGIDGYPGHRLHTVVAGLDWAVDYMSGNAGTPRLTEEQVAMLKAAWTLGARYIAREGNSGLRLSDNAPLVLMGGRLKITDDSLTMYIESYGNPLVELVKQSDPAPLDIVQVLRQNGVEVGG